MTSISPKKFKWIRALTARESVELWREKRKTIRQDFESRTAAARTSFNNVWYSQASGAAELGAQAALKRIQAETKAKAAEQAAANADDNIIPSTRNSVFSIDSSATLAGGSKIDLKAGTLTLSDGTVIDLATGTKKVSIVV